MKYNATEIQQLYHDLILGTVIRGTHRTQDLIPAFLNMLAIVDSATYEGYTVSPFGPVPAYAMEDSGSVWWDSGEAAYLLESLFDDLNAASPEGFYFGAHPGDGSDYGFWEIEE